MNAKSNSISHNQHYVPQMYLKNWENNGNVLCYRLLVSHESVPLWTRQSVTRTASQDKIYTRIENDVELDNFEQEFNHRFETPAKTAIEKACNGEELTKDEWIKLVDYVAAQYVRTPAQFQWVTEWGRAAVPQILDQVAAELNSIKQVPKRPEVPEYAEESNLIPLNVEVVDRNYDEKYSEVKIETVVGKSLWLFSIKHMLADGSSIRRAFQDLKWSIITSADGVNWPTSDNPVGVMRMDKRKNMTPSQGIINKKNVVLMALSPGKAIIGKRLRTIPSYFTADISFSYKIKKAIVSNSFFYIYSNFEDEDVHKIRPRTVDRDEYNRLKKEYEDWFDKYREQEAPLLRKR